METIDLAFVQVDYNTKMPINEAAYTLWDGCQKMGIETRFYSFLADIRKDLTKSTLVHGWIGHVKGALLALGCTPPEVISVPERLIPYFGRKLWITTMGEARKSHERMFIKPLRVHKAFIGYVLSGEFRDLIPTAHVPDDLELLASEPVTFVSEYRTLVHHGEIVAVRHYTGDPTIFPDMKLAKEIVSNFQESPCAYSLDLGVTDEGRTLIIEINDAFSLGSYGTPSIIYTRAVIDRWAELTNHKVSQGEFLSEGPIK